MIKRESLNEYLLNFFNEESLKYCKAWDKKSIDFKRLEKKINDYNYIYNTDYSYWDIKEA